MLFSREWAMPNKNTFSIKPISLFVNRWVAGKHCIIDLFARDCSIANITNDLNPATSATFNMDAVEFLDLMIIEGIEADVVLLDPPYSPRQISECYEQVGRKCGMRDTQNAALYKACKDRMKLLLKPAGIALSFGWNSSGFGKEFSIEEILLVSHGGAHNDTICMAEKRL